MRYIVLVLLCLPVILLALINIVTQYKMKKITRHRYRSQFVLWFVILIVLICSFPIYNLIIGKPIFDSSELSLFDVVEITVIVYLFYVVNDHRRKIERNEKTTRDLHQELSIKLSTKENEKN